MEQVPGCLIDSNQMNVNGNDRHIIAWITGQLYAMKFVTEQKNGGVQRWQLSLKTKHNLLECVVDAIRLWYFSIVSKIHLWNNTWIVTYPLNPLPCPPVLIILALHTMCADPELDIWQKVMILGPTVNVNSWLFSVNAYHTLRNLMADFQ